MGHKLETEACVPPQGQTRDPGSKSGWSWERKSSPSSEGNAKSERRSKVGEDDMDSNGAVESNVNVGFGSETVDPPPLPRVKNPISDWDELGLMTPIVRNASRTEVETPPSNLALVSSPPLFQLREMGEGDSIDEGGTRSAPQNHTRVHHLSQTPSRYVRNSSRLGVGILFTPRSHGCLASLGVAMDAVDVAGGVNAGISDKHGGGSRNVSDEEKCAQFRFPPANVHPNLSPGSDSEVRSCSPTTGPPSPQTEVLSGFRFSAPVRDDNDTAPALQRRLRPDRLNGVIAGKTRGCVGIVDGCQPSGRLSVAAVDGFDDGEEELRWAGRIGPSTRADASQDLDAHISRCSSPLDPASGSCADADVNACSRGLLAGSYSMDLPRSHYPGLSPDRPSVFWSRLRRHAKGRNMRDMLSPCSRSRFRASREIPTPNFPKAATSSFSPKPLEEAPHTYDGGASPDNTKLNTDRNTPWLIQTHEHVRSYPNKFDVLGFSSSSPSTLISGSPSSLVSAPRNLHLDQDKFDGDRDSDTGGYGSGFNEHLALSGQLRKDVRIKMKPDLSTRTGLNGASDGAVLSCGALRCSLAAKPIDNLTDGDVNVLGHVAGIEHGDMGALESFGPLAIDHCGPASPISGSVSVNGVSGVSAVGSPFTRALGVRSHIDDESVDIQARASMMSSTMSTQSRSIGHCDGGEGEPEECGLLKSLLEFSDPWGLMKKKVLNIHSPTPEGIERGEKKEKDLVGVKGGFERRGVGYVTPPSMDVLLGVIRTSDEAEAKEVWESGPGDDELQDLQENLDFRSSQPHTGSLLDLEALACPANRIPFVTRPPPPNIRAP